MAVSRVSLSSITQGFPKSRSFLDGNSAYIPSSFESIATVTGNGSATTLTFSSIPSTYKHLQIRGIAKDASGNNIQMRFNSDTGSNYTYHFLRGTGSAAGASGGANQTVIDYCGRAVETADANIVGVLILDIMDYTDTSKYKTARNFTGYDQNTNGGQVFLSSGLWRSTSAITSITLLNQSAIAFSSTTQFALYGIKG